MVFLGKLGSVKLRKVAGRGGPQRGAAAGAPVWHGAANVVRDADQEEKECGALLSGPRENGRSAGIQQGRLMRMRMGRNIRRIKGEAQKWLAAGRMSSALPRTRPCNNFWHKVIFTVHLCGSLALLAVSLALLAP